jgi:hypothetical protein
MSTDLGQAVAEAGGYLGHFDGLADTWDVFQVGEEYGYRVPLTLRTLRALHELAKDVHDTAAAYGAQDLERVLSRER